MIGCDGSMLRHSGRWCAGMRRLLIPLLALPLVLTLASCTTPSKANVRLRKINQDQQDRIAQLERTHAADRAKIAGLESSVTTEPTLSPERLDQLYTVHGLRLGRLTGGADLDANKPGDEGLKIYVVPTDQQGQDIKAAGVFTIEAFDLADESKPEIGRWQFDLEQSRNNWYGSLLYSYVLTCPWQTIPTHSNLTIKITFIDALTGRKFEVQKVVDVTLPGQPNP